MVRFLAAILGTVIVLVQAPASAADRHAGYYYPKPVSTEVYKSRALTQPNMGRKQRNRFVIGVVSDMLDRPHPPGLSFFAKGAELEKLIIVANNEGQLNTIYRVRALLATLTASARTSPLFVDYKVEDILTFLDMLKLLGFAQLTISDGDAFAHQITLE